MAKVEFYVLRVETRATGSQGFEVVWVPLAHKVSAADAATAVASVRGEVGPGVIVAVPVAQVYTAAAVERREMDVTAAQTNPIAP